MINNGVQQALGIRESIVTLRTFKNLLMVGFNQGYLSEALMSLSPRTNCSLYLGRVWMIA